MDWKLIDVVQETEHPFLNYFTLVYEVSDGNKKKEYRYFAVSRHQKDELLARTKKYSKPDGVTIPLYYLDENGKVFFLLVKQFRPALGRYVYSFPAGLLDDGEEDILETARREALEEAGAVVTDLKMICPPSSTSSGFSDETNAIVLGRILSFDKQKLEEFEDISYALVSKEETMKMLNDGSFFAMTCRLLLMYLEEMI